MNIENRPLGIWMLTALVVGNMVGAGVFLLPASLAAFGSISLLSWCVATGGALLLAIVFARLSAEMPKVGGPYAYCRAAFGDFVGFQVAYSYWVYVWIGNAAITVASVSYLSFFFPILSENPLVGLVVSLLILWVMTGINTLGVKHAGRTQLLLTIIKLIPLVLIAFVGIFTINPENFQPFNASDQSNFSALMTATTLTLWAFMGLESATVPADRANNPEKNIPRATLMGTLLAASIYILGSVAIMGNIPQEQLSQSNAPYSDAGVVIFGGWMSWIIAVGAVVSCLGALNGWILLQAQVPMAAARDGLFPKIFAKTSKEGSPVMGLLLSSTLISILLILNYGASLVDQFTFIILLATLAALIPYTYATLAELILFYHQREQFSQRRLWRSAIISLLAFAYVLWAIAGAGMEVVYYGILLLFAGTPFYVWMKLINGRASSNSRP